MNILQAAYDVCKYVQSLPVREKIKELTHNLHRGSPERQTQSRSYGELGYLGKRASIQFLGYLVVSQKRNVLENFPFRARIEPLSSNELSLLEKTHRFILQIDKKCSNYLGAILSNAIDAIDPYIKYSYKFQHTPDKGIDLNVGPVNNLCAAFTEHPSLKIIRKYVSHTNNIHQVPKKRLLDAVLTTVNRIDSSGLFNVPSDLEKLEMTVRKSSQEYYVSKILTALVSLRTSLSMLNQLLYQAFQFDKLTVLDKNNVFEIERHSKNLLGESISVFSQLLSHEVFSNTGGITLVKLHWNNYEIDGLYHIERINVSLNADFGSSMKLGLRRIDINLNYYPGLTRDG